MEKMTLKQARLMAEMTLAEVAKKVGKTPQTISMWESGKTSITVMDFLTLCKLYGRPMDSIILPIESS